MPDENRAPFAIGPGFDREEMPCPVCSQRWVRYVGEGVYSVKGGASWTDALPVAGFYPPYLVSERVAKGLEAIGATGYKLLPVRFSDVEGNRLQRLPEPKYYYLSVSGMIDIDIGASGLGSMDWCPACKASTSKHFVQHLKHVPIRESWDGSDIFKVGPRPTWGVLYCTRRVLELARNERWSSFQFEPMDIVRRHSSSWGGIDYLGDAWPPKNWYPTPPSAGKSLAEWVDQMRRDDPEGFRQARIAISDIAYDEPEAVIPELAKMLDEADEKRCRHAARMLGLIYAHSGLVSKEIRNRISPLVSDNLRSKLD